MGPFSRILSTVLRRLAAQLATVLSDAAYGLRLLRRAPVLAAAAMTSLALGIGATTGVFAVADALLMRPLPVPEPSRLFVLEWQSAERPDILYWGSNRAGRAWSVSRPLLEQLASASPAPLAGYQDLSEATLLAKGEAATATGVLVTGSYFRVLGLTPAAGRLLEDGDDRAGAPPAIVIGYALWTSRFNRDTALIGTSVSVSGQVFTVVGVAPRGFFGVMPGRIAEFYVPTRWAVKVLRNPFGEDLMASERVWWLQVFGRRPAGHPLNTLAPPLHRVLTAAAAPVVKTRRQAVTLVLREAPNGFALLHGRDSRRPFFVLLPMAALVLLAACANVGTLLLARASRREKEAAMRLALGAARVRLIRQHLTESLTLSLLGGIASTVIALWLADLLVALAPDPHTVVVAPGGHWRVGAFALAASIFAGLLAGIGPSLFVAGRRLGTALRAGGTVRSGGSRRMARPLVAAQLAASLFLLIVAGLFARSLANLYAQPIGFDPKGLVLFNLDPLAAGSSRSRKIPTLTRIVEDVRRIPGVRAATWSTPGLLSGGSWEATFGAPDGPRKTPLSCKLMWVGPSFHHTLAIQLAQGRLFDERDGPGRSPVVIVNQRLVNALFGGVSPIGRVLRMEYAGGADPYTVVGVVRDTAYGNIADDHEPIVFLADAQAQFPAAVTFEVRAAAGAEVGDAIRRVVGAVDPTIPVVRLRTMREQVDAQLTGQRGLAAMSMVFGAISLVLAMVGLYGVTSFAVARRTGEIGVRLALGAIRRSVLALVLGDAALVLVPGALFGLAAALSATRMLASLLFGLAPTDAVTMVAAVAVLAAVSLLAIAIPARRATSVDPCLALRRE